ncbi:hypothetical protein K5X82_04930 [Halosquirtibacter xylanolyticus]|uniref:hypothetical protein n=1 Tax=Halosquirtibacter xylanolyticus TaxID=3374599 RepID=UPI003749336D|nr:hypothetical protein K5X82_04930 [Prolixibacteraceae bacterium]
MKKIIMLCCCLGLYPQQPLKKNHLMQYAFAKTQEVKPQQTPTENAYNLSPLLTLKIDALESRIHAELKGQQQRLDDLKSLIHIVISFLIGLAGFLFYEKRHEKST